MTILHLNIELHISKRLNDEYALHTCVEQVTACVRFMQHRFVNVGTLCKIYV